MAIIGVVAALTIPVIIQKYQQKQLYSQFIKTFNTLSNAISLAVAENGQPDTWGIDDDNAQEILEKNILPYLKIAKKIEESDNEYDYPVSLLNGDDAEYTAGWNQYGDGVYVLSDGTIVGLWVESTGGGMVGAMFDTNGIKGPNVVGRDYFSEGYCYKKADNKYISAPCSMFESKDDGTYTLKSREQLYNEFFGDDAEFNCTPDKKGGEFNCASRLMLDGKMDY